MNVRHLKSIISKISYEVYPDPLPLKLSAAKGKKAYLTPICESISKKIHEDFKALGKPRFVSPQEIFSHFSLRLKDHSEVLNVKFEANDIVIELTKEYIDQVFVKSLVSEDKKNDVFIASKVTEKEIGTFEVNCFLARLFNCHLIDFKKDKPKIFDEKSSEYSIQCQDRNQQTDNFPECNRFKKSEENEKFESNFSFSDIVDRAKLIVHDSSLYSEIAKARKINKDFLSLHWGSISLFSSIEYPLSPLSRLEMLDTIFFKKRFGIISFLEKKDLKKSFSSHEEKLLTTIFEVLVPSKDVDLSSIDDQEVQWLLIHFEDIVEIFREERTQKSLQAVFQAFYSLALNPIWNQNEARKKLLAHITLKYFM